MKIKTIAMSITIALILAGCGAQVADKAQTSEAPAANDQGSALKGLLTGSEPADALSVHALKADDHTGQEVVVTGRIGGTVEPFVQNRAMFMMADMNLEMCTTEGDHCETPWDACCETPEDRIASAITVQVKDGAGAIIKEDLNGFSGLDPLAMVTVTGTVSEQNDQVLVLDAKSIYIHPSNTSN